MDFESQLTILATVDRRAWPAYHTERPPVCSVQHDVRLHVARVRPSARADHSCSIIGQPKGSNITDLSRCGAMTGLMPARVLILHGACHVVVASV